MKSHLITPAPITLQPIPRRLRHAWITQELDRHLTPTILALEEVTVDVLIRAHGADVIPVLAGIAALGRVPAVALPVFLVADIDAHVMGAALGVGVGGAVARSGGVGVGVDLGAAVAESDEFLRGSGGVLGQSCGCYEEGEEEGGDVHGCYFGWGCFRERE